MKNKKKNQINMSYLLAHHSVDMLAHHSVDMKFLGFGLIFLLLNSVYGENDFFGLQENC